MPIIDANDLATFRGIGDNIDDDRFTLAAAAASKAVQEYCGRTFDVPGESDEATARVFRPMDGCRCPIDDAVSVELVEVGSGIGSFTELEDFVLEPLNGLRQGQEWPYMTVVAATRRFRVCTVPSVRVTAQWGWQSVPEDVVLAACIKGARLFRRKDSPEGLMAGFAEFGPVRIASTDRDVVELLNPYRHESLSGS